MTVKTVKGVAAGIDHGTMRGYRQHKYRGVPTCEDCLRAVRDDAKANREPKGERRAQAWNGGMVGESVRPVSISATPAACVEPECGTEADGLALPDSWHLAEVDGVDRRYCRRWCAVYAQALADVRSIGRKVAA